MAPASQVIIFALKVITLPPKMAILPFKMVTLQ